MSNAVEHPLLPKLREDADKVRALAADARGERLSGHLRELANLEGHIAAIERGEPCCRECGGTSFRAWYPVDEGQGIDVERTDDGSLVYEYDGDTTSGESGADYEYWCRDCDTSARTLEYLVGDTDEDGDKGERLAAQAARDRYGSDDIEVGRAFARPDDEAERVEDGYWVNARVWVSACDVATFSNHTIDCDMGEDCTCGATERGH